MSLIKPRYWLPLAVLPGLAILLCGCGKNIAGAVTTAAGSAVVPREVHSDLASVPDKTIISINGDAQKMSGIQVATAQNRLVNFTVKTTGEVNANANLLTHVTTPVTGRVVSIMVRVGDRIAEGAPLLTIRSTDIEQSEGDLLQNEAQVRADLSRDLLQVDSDIAIGKSQLKLSESTFQRTDDLVREKIASRASYESAKTQFEKDKITIDSLQRKREATLVLSRERMKLLIEPIKQKLRLLGLSDSNIENVLKTRRIDPMVPVLAPESGIVSERLVNVGELVDPSKPLFTLANYKSVWIKADVYERDLSKVKEGQPIALEVDSFPDESFVGHLNYVADSINPDTRVLAVRAEVQNPSLKLKPKMFARMNILVGDQSVLTIPKSAVQDAGSYKVVYIPLGSGKFEERRVKIGTESGDYLEVLSGLHANEKVVSKGSFDLRSESLETSN